jgi:AraC-like DNA-binding protein
LKRTFYTSEMAVDGEERPMRQATIERTTIGRDIFHGKKVPVFACGLEGLHGIDDPNRLKVIFLKSGSGILGKGKGAVPILSPSIIMVDQKDSNAVEISPQSASGAVLFFHPRYVNDALSFEALESKTSLSEPDAQDRYLLVPFFQKTAADRILFVQPDVFRYFEALFHNMRRTLELQEDRFWPCRARSFLLEILIHLQHCCSKNGPLDPALRPVPEFPWIMAADAGSRIGPILAFLARNYSRRITVTELAERFSTNRTTIQKLFKTVTGWSIAQYLIRMRVQIASLMLRDTTITVTEIIERTGFENLSHFSRTFKKFAELTPSEYRKMFRVPDYIVQDDPAGYARG